MATIFGKPAVVSGLYHAFNGTAAGNATYVNNLGYATSNSDVAYANALAGNFAGASSASLAATVLTNMGVNTPSLLTALTALFNGYGVAARGQIVLNLVNLLSGLEGDATWGAAAVAWNKTVAVDNVYSTNTANTTDAVVTASSGIDLTTGLDNKFGTNGADVFTANLVNNSNTLQSGDKVNGGAGFDTLNATLGNSSAFAIAPITASVEAMFFRSQANNATGNAGDNNVSAGGVADGNMNDNTVDAQDMRDVVQWWSTDARADLVIEDVRINDNQITSDITIGWANADPSSATAQGVDKVDYEVYFSPESLRKQNNSTSNAITLTVGNQVETATFDAANPLKDIPYTHVQFLVNGTAVVLALNLTGVSTYTQLWTAVQTAFAAAQADAAYATLLADVTLSRSIGTDSFFSKDGVLRFADEYILTKGNGVIAPSTTGWWAEGGLPSNNAFGANVEAGAAIVTSSLITSTVILDNVGRESEAGALVIGSMSTRTGVERFNVTVENNDNTSGAYTSSGSWLSSMSSTNNFLREVNVVNGVLGTSGPDYLYLGTGMDEVNNNLTTIRQTFLSTQSTVAGRVAYQAKLDAALLNTDGLTDVRLFDASAMTGQVKVGAAITAASILKYQDLVDTAAAHGADDVAFEYKTGAANDSINLAIDGNVLASNSSAVVGRHDFSFAVNGGAGNDHIQVKLVDGLTGGTENWYNNQAINNNVTVNGGDGNDTIRTPGAGNVNIIGGAGDDTVYADNTGVQALASAYNDGRAVYVFNAADGDAVLAGNQYFVGDLESQAAATVSAVNAQLTVTFKGLTSTAVIADSAGKLANVAITDLSVNQAIKAAINSDAVLNKLLIAEDGPGRTLIVRSLIDGADVAPADLGITFGTTGALSAGQIAAGAAVTLFNPAAAATVTDGYVTTNFGQYDALGGSAVPAVAEVFVATFGATVDPDTVTFDATPAVVLVAGQTGAQNAAQYATAYNLNAGATWTAVNVAGQATVTFTKKVAGVVVDAVTADFVVASGGAGADVTVTAAVPTTQGAAAIAAASEIVGAASTSTSDNTITGGTGNDVIVLGTTLGADVLNSSNDKVVYAAGVFGNDTIVNFAQTGFGIDTLDFTALGGVAAGFGAVLTVDKSITVTAELVTNDTAAEVGALFSANNVAAQTHVYVAYNAANVGMVYSVVDAIGANNAVATLVGTIDLADTSWVSLTVANFA